VMSMEVTKCAVWLCLVKKLSRRQSPFVRNHLHPRLLHSNGQTPSPLPCVDLPPDCRFFVRKRSTPLNDLRHHVRFSHPTTPESGLTLYFLLPLVSPTRSHPFTCMVIGLNPMILIFLVVALPPTRPLAETPKPQRSKPRSMIPLE